MIKTDVQLHSDIAEELTSDPSLDASRIAIAVSSGIVTLTGTVRSYWQKIEAENATKRVTGVRGVANDLTVELPSGHVRNDTDIATAASDALAWHSDLPKTIQVAVSNGSVTLSGTVEWQFQKTEAEKAVNPNILGVALRATYRPATHSGPMIGGDWYDVFQLPDGRVAVAIGDVTGHGVSASAQMVRLRETLRAAAVFEEPAPDRILARVNAAASIGSPALASALFGILDPETLTFAYATAGHPAPILVREDQAVVLPSEGTLLGADAAATYAVRTARLRVGDRLVLFTDGLIEATRDIVEGEARLLAALAGGVFDPEALIATVAGEVLRDDITLLMLHLIESAPAAQAVRAPWRFLSDDARIAAPSRASFTAYLRHRGIDEENVVAAEVVFGELVGNVVRHAPGPIEIELFWSDVPSIVVRDRGPGFVLEETIPDPYAEGGRGVFLMQQLGAELEVRPRPGGGSEIVAKLLVLRSVSALT